MSADNTGPETGKPVKEDTGDIVRTVLIALLITLVFRTFLFQPFTIPSASMEPNLYEGDYIVVSKWNYGYSKHSIQFSPPLFEGRIFAKQAERGDIVVFKLPRDNKTDYIKRVIGVPGDKVQLRNGQVFLNDERVPLIDQGPVMARYGNAYATIQQETLNGKRHLIQDLRNDTQGDNSEAFIVPENHYFVMGDNRDDSLDSRFAAYNGGVGFVPAENLEGKATMVLISWNRGASLWKPWTWLDLRWDRFFRSLH